MILPEFSDAFDRVSDDKATPIDLFIVEHEPSKLEKKDAEIQRWRGDLYRALHWAGMTCVSRDVEYLAGQVGKLEREVAWWTAAAIAAVVTVFVLIVCVLFLK